jgi:hypothetical protein
MKVNEKHRDVGRTFVWNKILDFQWDEKRQINFRGTTFCAPEKSMLLKVMAPALPEKEGYYHLSEQGNHHDARRISSWRLWPRVNVTGNGKLIGFDRVTTTDSDARTIDPE